MRLCLTHSDCANHGQCVYGACVCASNYITNKNDTNAYNAVTLPVVGAILYDNPTFYNVYLLVFTFLTCAGLISHILSLTTFIRRPIRFTVCGVYLNTFSICGLIGMILLLISVIISIRYNHYLLIFWACFGHSYVLQCVIDISILMTVAIAIENALIRYLRVQRFRSRRSAVCIILYLLAMELILNLDKILNRSLKIDKSGRFYCTYDFRTNKFWFYIKNSAIYFYIIIPCLIHAILVLLVLKKLIQQKRKWYRKIFTHLDVLLPSLIMILCLSTYHIVRSLLDSCIIYSNQLYIRLCIGLLLIIYIPLIFTFIIYILPNQSYLKEFQKTWIYRLICYCLGYEPRQLIDYKIIKEMWQKKHTLDNIMTISNLNDYFNQGDFYKNSKLEV